MQLENAQAIVDLDSDFGAMAVRCGQFAWGLPELSMREKAFAFVAADLCSHGLQLPLQMHVTMAVSHGVALEDIREAVRHLAPYAGYPTAAEALGRLVEIAKELGEVGSGTQEQPAQIAFPTAISDGARALNGQFAAFLHEQFSERWSRPGLSVAERALCTLATDVLNGTLEESFELHVGLALDHGASKEQVREVLLLVAEFGMAKAWRAFKALEPLLAARQ